MHNNLSLSKREKHILLSKLEQQNLIQPLISSSAIIAGGSLRSVFCNQPINDYDLYFTNLEDITKLINSLSSDSEVKHIVKTEIADTFQKGDVTIQIIKKFIPKDIQEMFDMFDFTICMAAYDIAKDMLYMDDSFLKHNAQRRISFNSKTKYPLSSFHRLRKYIDKYGYTIDGSEVIKMGLCVNRIEIETYADLKDALMGIDTMFLCDLMKELDGSEIKDNQYDFDNFMFIIDDYIAKHYDKFLND